MNHTLKKILKIIVPIAIGIALVLYQYHSTTAADRTKIFDAIRNANPFWVLLSIGMGVVGHISRAIRWNYLLEPLGYRPKLHNNIMLVFLCYFANLGIPRSGEILRVTGLTTYEKVPFETGLGTVVTERIIDLVMLLVVILTALLLQTDIILGVLDENGLGLLGSIGILLFGVAGLFVAIKLVQRSTQPIAVKLKTFLNGLLKGILSIFAMKNKWAFLGHTLFIWACYVGMFWAIKYTVPETISLSFGPLLVAFIAGAFAMAATNGGLGLFPIAVAAALAFFGIDKTSGDAFGWIMWTGQTLMLVLFGAISFLLLPLLNRNK